MTTAFHARYFAHELTRHHREGGVGSALFNACVELNPHQIEAASFALRNPLSSGVLLADEVGLGKTIEAGLVLCQYWSEKRRRLLIICPASLRKQWSVELTEKFNLPNVVVDARSRESLEQVNRVVIVSYNFASARRDEPRAIPFELVVIDETHKLRNVYKTNTGIAANIKSALSGRRKILLTATPLQNASRLPMRRTTLSTTRTKFGGDEADGSCVCPVRQLPLDHRHVRLRIKEVQFAHPFNVAVTLRRDEPYQ